MFVKVRVNVFEFVKVNIDAFVTKLNITKLNIDAFVKVRGIRCKAGFD